MALHNWEKARDGCYLIFALDSFDFFLKLDNSSSKQNPAEVGFKIKNHKFFNLSKVLRQSQTANDDLGFCGGNDRIIIQIKQYGQWKSRK